MGSTTLIGLINNAALLLALGLLYDTIALRRPTDKPSLQMAFTGVMLGGIGLAVMLTPWEFAPGVIFDTRSVLLSLVGLFFGGVPTIIAIVMTSLLRLYQGGIGVVPGIAVIVTSGALGLFWRFIRLRDLADMSNGELYFFGIVVHVNMLLCMLILPWEVAMRVLSTIGPPVIIIFPVGTMLLGRVLLIRLRRRQAEEAVRITLNSIDEAVITIDQKGAVVLMNPVAERLTNWPSNRAVGRLVSDVCQLCNYDTGEIIQNPAVTALQASKNINGQTIGLMTLVASEEQTYTVESSATLIRDVENDIRGVVLVLRDVTEKLKVEQELLKISKLKSVGVLAGGIAHDFNNLLTGLFGQVALAKMNLTADHKAYRFVEVAERSLDKAAALTQQLLTFAKGGEPIKEAISTEEVIQETAVFNLAGSNVKLHLDMPDDLWQIEADKGQISQVISNLVINASQAMPGGGSLYVTAENYEHTAADYPVLTAGLYVKIVIRDEGHGIAADNLSKIFDPYFSTKEAGSGLGLATVYSIVRKHYGQVTVESVEGEGATFTVYLPAVVADSLDVALCSSTSETAKSLSVSKILIMDDDEIVRDVASKMLTMIGHTAVCASDGQEAVTIYHEALEKQKPFDVVIMDLTVAGGMGGQEAVKKILEIDSHARVIVSSGYSTDPVLANYEEYGFRGRVVKPYLPEDLYQAIQQVLP